MCHCHSTPGAPLWHHLTQQQLDPSASWKRKLVQYSLYGQRCDGFYSLNTLKDCFGNALYMKEVFLLHSQHQQLPVWS